MSVQFARLPTLAKVALQRSHQDELVEAKAQCKRLHEQAASLQHKNKGLVASKKELASIAQQLAIS